MASLPTFFPQRKSDPANEPSARVYRLRGGRRAVEDAGPYGYVGKVWFARTGGETPPLRGYDLGVPLPNTNRGTRRTLCHEMAPILRELTSGSKRNTSAMSVEDATRRRGDF